MVFQVRTCRVCKTDKQLNEFIFCYTNNKGVAIHARTCKECTRNKDSVRAKAYYNSVRGKAMDLLKGARRNNKANAGFELDLDFIIDKLTAGVCEATGIPFSYESSSEKYKTNKLAPSLDRVDNSKGYTKDNVRAVVWWYNLMKNDETDEVLLEFCKAVVNSKSK